MKFSFQKQARFSRLQRRKVALYTCVFGMVLTYFLLEQLSFDSKRTSLEMSFKPGAYANSLPQPKLKQENDEKEDFIGCEHQGYIDSSAYPLVDAQAVFCGLIVFNPMSNNLGILNGLLSLNFAEDCSGLSKDCDQHIRLSNNAVIFLDKVSHESDHSVITVKNIFSFTPNSLMLTILKRNNSMQDSAFYFLPEAFNTKEVLLLLRAISSKCQPPARKTKQNYFASISSITSGTFTFASEICLYMEIIGSSIKQAYIISPGRCNSELKFVCFVDKINVDSIVSK
ncbi:uncharacterized protein LOC143464564 isoform X2 [Clavelina lepadiformis]|uniref:uncharacterized protein LOC143464564 isoform X2 n=1 Tax=Clavelina lepadiformis TaxID=159417 RepID=UPI004042B047